MPEPDAKAIIKRTESLKGRRSVYENHVEEVRELMNPGGDEFISQSTLGAKAHQKVFDGTAEQASQMFSASLMGLMSNPATNWFRLRAVSEALNNPHENAIWLEDATRRMLNVFRSPDRGFVTAQHQKMMEVGDYGTGGMYIAEEPGLGPVFQTRPLSELLISDGKNDVVDTVHRAYTLPARKAALQFGDKAGEKVIKAAGDPEKAEQPFRFIHAVFPREDRIFGRLDGANRPFASVFVNVEEKQRVGVGGFFEFPYVVPRWSKRANEPYGRGQGMVALSDTKSLQRSMRLNLDGGELAMRPPLQVPDDGMMGPLRMSAKGINFVRSDLLARGAGISAISSGVRPDIGEEMMDRMRSRIENAFFKPILQTLRDPRMTATQVLQIAEEMLRTLGPILGRLQTEDLGRMIKRVFAIMFRRGMFLPLPEGLSEVELKIEYQSPIALAQRLEEIRGISNTLDIISPLTQSDPEVLDNIDADATFRHVAELLGWPRDTLRSPDLVEELRQARRDAQAGEVAKQDANAAGQTAAQLLPALAGLAPDQLATAEPAGTA